MGGAERIDVLLHSFLSRFFSIPARQPAAARVTFAQMRILWVVNAKGSATLSEVAGRLGVSSSTATELVDRLVKEGYVRRDRSAVDRREVAISLLSKGRRLVADFARHRRSRLQKLIGALAPGDVDRMARALETLNEIVEKIHAEQP